MLRRLCLTVLCFVAALPSMTKADEALQKALATIPTDAVAFLTVPSLKTLDADYQQAVNALGLGMFLPPPSNSIIALMKQSLPLTEGFDENGSLSVVAMPADSKEKLASTVAVLVPATDAKALATAMGGQEGEGGVWTVQLFGPPMFAVPTENMLAISQSPDGAKAAAAATKGIAKRLDDAELALMDGMNIALWIDAASLLKTFKTEFDGLTGMLMMMQSMGGPAGVEQGEATKKQFDMLANGAKSIGLALALKSTGLTLRGGLTSNKGSELATRMKMKNTTSSLLTGLPGDKYLIATGQIIDAEQVKSSLPQMAAIWDMLKASDGIDASTVDSLKATVEAWLPTMTGARASLQMLTAGPDGLFGAAAVIDTTDSKQWLASAGKAFDLAKQLVAQSGVANVGADGKNVLDAFTHGSNAEKIAGAGVDQFRINLKELGEIPDEDLGKVHKLIGQDGVMIRMAAVNGKQVAIGFGGGASFMTRLIENVKNEKAPLDSDAGIKKVAALLPKSRASVLYIAVDNIISAIQSAATILGEEFPLTMPAVNAPVAFCVSGGAGSSRFDLVIPMELISQGKNTAMMAMMSNMGGSGGAPPPPQ